MMLVYLDKLLPEEVLIESILGLQSCSKGTSITVEDKPRVFHRRRGDRNDNNGDWRRDNGRKLQQGIVGQIICDALGNCNDGRCVLARTHTKKILPKHMISDEATAHKSTTALSCTACFMLALWNKVVLGRKKNGPECKASVHLLLGLKLLASQI